MSARRKFRSLLIVNADDFNLTEGVSQGILEAHDRGIVTSTTAFPNFPVSNRVLKALKKRPSLGIGIHLNVTLGNPLLASKLVPSLVDWRGGFARKKDFPAVSRVELLLEYECQIEHFRQVFGRWPTHLDTHHHVHSDPAVFEVVKQLAYRYRLPLRLSRCFGREERKLFLSAGVPCVDALIEDLNSNSAWTEASLLRALRSVRAGITELMCHPAFCDEKLSAISSFNRPREGELDALCSKKCMAIVTEKKIGLVNFSELKACLR